MSGHPDNPVPAPVQTPVVDQAANRRKLVRMAVSGAPLLLSLPTAVSAQTLSSAYRAASNDMSQNPPRVTTGPDGWIRILATSLTPPGNSALPALYQIGTNYYRQSDGQLVTGVNPNPYTTSPVYLLVLFSVNLGASIDGGTPYPLTSTGSGLHRSAWLSVNPTGNQNYNGIAWVS